MKSALDHYIEIVEFAGCLVESKQTELAVTSEDETRWQKFISSLPADLQKNPIVTFNAGGAFGEAKHWSTRKFAELGQSLVDNYERTSLCCVVLPNEIWLKPLSAKRIASMLSAWPKRNSPSVLSKAAVKHSELLVTTDSGPRHFAQPFDVPVITIFGPTHIGYSETYYEKGTHIQLPGRLWTVPTTYLPARASQVHAGFNGF